MAVPGRNIYEQQALNRRLTVVVMAVFIAFVALLGFGVDVFILGWSTSEETFLPPIPLATIVAMGVGLASSFWSLRGGAASVLKSSGAVPVSPDNPAYRQLQNVVEEVAIAAGLPPPALYVIPDPDPNAFATGSDPAHSCIAVTQGLVDRLSREELQGVVAHEMSHIRNYDTRMMTVVAALIGASMLLSEFGLRSMRFGAATSGRRSDNSKRDSGGGSILFVFWLIAMILAPLIARILAMAVSRRREFLADASGAELTRNPMALASALGAIESAVEPTRSIKKGTAHLCIVDPLGSALNNREGTMADIFATHPPIQRRIAALRAMSYLGPAQPVP